VQFEIPEKGEIEMLSVAKMPTRLRVIGWLNLVGGIVFMLAALAPSNPTAPLHFLIGAVSVTIGVGLLKRQAWARVLAIAAYAVNVLGGLASLNFVAVIISSAIIAYLCGDAVKAIFAESALSVSPVPQPEKLDVA
jgi:hypothetical protein